MASFPLKNSLHRSKMAAPFHVLKALSLDPFKQPHSLWKKKKKNLFPISSNSPSHAIKLPLSHPKMAVFLWNDSLLSLKKKLIPDFFKQFISCCKALSLSSQNGSLPMKRQSPLSQKLPLSTFKSNDNLLSLSNSLSLPSLFKNQPPSFFFFSFLISYQSLHSAPLSNHNNRRNNSHLCSFPFFLFNLFFFNHLSLNMASHPVYIHAT